jgi:GntR family transcriptional regulator
MRQQQRQPETRLLAASVGPATPEVARQLGLTPGEPAIYIARLRLADGLPVIYETRHLAQSLCPELLQEDLEYQSIHWLLIHKHHVPMIRTTHTIEVHLLEPDEADLLQLEPGTAAFFVDRLTYTLDETGERPAVWYQALYRGDNYYFKAEFQALS